MKIFVVGSTGRVAENLIKDLVRDGHEVVAGARKIERVIELEHVTPVHFDLHDDVDEMTKSIKDVDAVYFVAGSRGRDLLQTDAFGAVKVMQAAEKNGIKRFIMLSSMFSLEPQEWHREGLADLTDYNIAKFFADNYLISNTKLDYTILQPASLTEEEGTGKVSINCSGKQNAIPNVAQVLAALLKHDNTIKKVIRMSDGDQNIDDALTEL
ncbi:SDR family oxidoreductase [Pediococcus pentosaceus]|uniref:SDR family oxidoreductase n=1 Tax=Pediococcus pentosaceus TaxID=1255 RepID=UPI0018E1C7AE|nr:SDR family oxidoreductase [Pediococcus pentosaceus]MBF7104492.1 SDR family oxidoreductase [Pediococcus pentosaceus]QQC61409.1 SDR family oxidoreductase [Pediococcus pentosaceus]